MMRINSRIPIRLLAAAALLCGGGLAWCFFNDEHKSEKYELPAKAYSGKSDGLTRTVIVPTLDTPVPQGRNVI